MGNRSAWLIGFILLLGACKSVYPNDKKLSYTAPVRVNDVWNDKKTGMGNPDKMGASFFSFYDKGMIVYLSDDKQKVNKIIFTWFMGGKHFTGDIYGVKMGDTYPKVTRLWGEPVETGNPTDEYYTKIWQFKNFGISVEFWLTGGNNVNFGGAYEAETVKRIEITA